jgi:hypothetical protein
MSASGSGEVKMSSTRIGQDSFVVKVSSCSVMAVERGSSESVSKGAVKPCTTIAIAGSIMGLSNGVMTKWVVIPGLTSRRPAQYTTSPKSRRMSSNAPFARAMSRPGLFREIRRYY